LRSHRQQLLLDCFQLLLMLVLECFQLLLMLPLSYQQALKQGLVLSFQSLKILQLLGRLVRAPGCRNCGTGGYYLGPCRFRAGHA
jgi:hypothetical protein